VLRPYDFSHRALPFIILDSYFSNYKMNYIQFDDNVYKGEQRMKKGTSIMLIIGLLIALFTGLGMLFYSCGGEGGGGTTDPGTLYVGGYGTAKIYVIKAEAKELITTIDLPDGAQPDWLTLSPDNKKIYCSSESDDMVYIIDTEKNTYTSVAVCLQPRGIAFTPDGSIAAVVCNTDDDISLIDTATETYNEETDTIYLGSDAENNGIAIHPTLNKCYVPHGTDILYADVEPDTMPVPTYSINAFRIYDVEVSSDGNRVYSSANVTDPLSLGEAVMTLYVDVNGSLSILDNAECISYNMKKLTLSPDQKKVYVPMLSTSAIDYMSTDDTSTMSSIDLSSYSQAGVYDVVFSSDSTKAFVAIDSTTDQVVVIDTATSNVDGTITLPAGSDPRSLVYKQ
jgi:YVTN family beta-propeller protein